MNGRGLSVVVLTWNERDQLRVCLEHLASARRRRAWQVIVVDNGSTDGTAEMVAREHPSVEIVVNPDNRGVAAGRNQGLERATGEYVAMIDSDAYVSPEALELLCAHLDANPGVGLVGPRLEFPDGTLQLSCRRFPTPVAMVANRVARLEHLPSRRRHMMVDEPHDRVLDVEYLLGATMVFRAAAGRALGGFDQRIRYGYDDADWAMRVWAGGLRVSYVPQAVVVHDYRRRGTKSVFSPQNAWIAGSYVLVRWAHRRVLSSAPWKTPEITP